MIDDIPCPCVFPASSEEELITIPGPAPRTALRAFVEPGPAGYVRLQQLAYTNGMGWYVQKSMVIPGEMLAALVPQLKKAQCLIPAPKRSNPNDLNVPFLRLVQDEQDHSDEPELERKRA